MESIKEEVSEKYTLTSFDGDPVGTCEGEAEGSTVVGLDVGISDG